MLLALDYDDTYTRDPGFWDAVVALGLSRGHRFIRVTSRDYSPGSTRPDRTPNPAIPVVCAGQACKAPAPLDSGFAVDLPQSINPPIPPLPLLGCNES